MCSYIEILGNSNVFIQKAMENLFEAVQIALQSNDVGYLSDQAKILSEKLSSRPKCSSAELTSRLMKNQLHRHIGAEFFIPSSMKTPGVTLTAIRYINIA